MKTNRLIIKFLIYLRLIIFLLSIIPIVPEKNFKKIENIYYVPYIRINDSITFARNGSMNGVIICIKTKSTFDFSSWGPIWNIFYSNRFGKIVDTFTSIEIKSHKRIYRPFKKAYCPPFSTNFGEKLFKYCNKSDESWIEIFNENVITTFDSTDLNLNNINKYLVSLNQPKSHYETTILNIPFDGEYNINEIDTLKFDN